jgi:hypothetical protein
MLHTTLHGWAGKLSWLEHLLVAKEHPVLAAYVLLGSGRR